MNEFKSTPEVRVELGIPPGRWNYLRLRYPGEWPRPQRFAGRMLWSAADVDRLRKLNAKHQRGVAAR